MTTALAQLFDRFDDCPLCRQKGNQLQHILGGGLGYRPKAALVLINPTYNNISSQPRYAGLRFPFVGVARFWRVLTDAGWLPPVSDDPRALHKLLSDRGIYLTNLVKCTSPHGNYPQREVFSYHWPLFQKELEIVQPQNIVAFGILPVKYLTGQTIKMRDFVARAYPLAYKNLVPVYPCYFPVGRGNPKLAVVMLRRIKARIYN